MIKYSLSTTQNATNYDLFKYNLLTNIFQVANGFLIVDFIPFIFAGFQIVLFYPLFSFAIVTALSQTVFKGAKDAAGNIHEERKPCSICATYSFCPRTAKPARIPTEFWRVLLTAATKTFSYIFVDQFL